MHILRACKWRNFNTYNFKSFATNVQNVRLKMWRDGICTDHDEPNGKVTAFDSIQMLLSAISSFHISGDQSSERKEKDWCWLVF